jgi:hypothetical protein
VPRKSCTAVTIASSTTACISRERPGNVGHPFSSTFIGLLTGMPGIRAKQRSVLMPFTIPSR